MDRTEDYFCHLGSEDKVENTETKSEEDNDSRRR